MKVGWNRQYILHCLSCEEWVSKSSKLLVLTVFLSSLVFVFPTTTGVSSDLQAVISTTQPVQAVNAEPVVAQTEKAAQVTRMLSRHGVDKERLPRVVEAILTSSAKYKVDPRLVASIVIVESGADPFAVSSAESVGMMQIHLGTWGKIADQENINLFKVEDNIDFGVRILRDYIEASDLWGGVARYRGWVDTPESQLEAQQYVRKVQRLYGIATANSTL
jgi:soluble lytic murein transglycosylase-like protein